MMDFDKALSRLALMLYEQLDTPVALSCYMLLKAGEYTQLADRQVEPRHYLDSEVGIKSYRRDSVAAAFLRKNADLPTDTDKSEVALQKWMEAEKACFVTNCRLNYLVGQDLTLFSDPLAVLIRRVRKIIAQLLGRAPSLETLEGDHGPGATVSHKGRSTIPLIKYYDPPSVSDNMPSSILEDLAYSTLWGSQLFDRYNGRIEFPSYDGNEWASVPKDCQTDRSIGIEPTLNIFYQKAIGSVMKRRLARFGLLDASPLPALCPELSFSVRNAQFRHRHLAREASLSCKEATIDLSSASDTVAYNLVKLCLPSDWFHLLDAVRCSKTVVRGTPYLLEKFSSMGNGYTFELETALFYAIIKAMAQSCGHTLRTLSVFGDDIIVDNEFADRAILALEGLGFSCNLRKTFTGNLPFRESCGGDYFKGVDVRPYFCKEVPVTPQEWFALHNGLRKLNLFSTRVEREILTNIPVRRRRLRGPEDLGDIVLHSEDEALWCTRVNRSIRFIKALIPQYESYPRERFDENCVLLGSLRGLVTDKVTGRGSALLGFRERWVPYS